MDRRTGNEWGRNKIMAILKLKAPTKNYIWGGRRLIDEYHKTTDCDILAESWELSCYPESASVIENGEYAGLALDEYIEKQGREVLGTDCSKFDRFPVLIKFIDAKQDLSIQVHPSDAYALKNENQYGKTEMWYVLDAEKGAALYYGFKKDISEEEFEKRIHDNTLIEVLNRVEVKKGDVFFIEQGTLHAIGAGMMIAEIQQNSNVTYRVYDHGRVGKDGKPRELHIAKALEVTNRSPVKKREIPLPHMAKCNYFTVDKISLSGDITDRLAGTVQKNSFLHILILDGEGSLKCGIDELHFEKGDSFFITAGSGRYELCGKCEAIMTYESE